MCWLRQASLGAAFDSLPIVSDSRAIFRSELSLNGIFVNMAAARHRHFSLVALLVSSPVAAHMAVTAQLGNASDYQATYAWIHGHHCRALHGLGHRRKLRCQQLCHLRANYVANNSTTSMGSKELDTVTSHWCRALHGLGIDANYVANNSATSVGPKVLILLLTFVSMAAARHRHFSLMALLVSSPVAATWKSRHSSATFQITRLFMLGFTGIIAGLLIAWGIGENYVANNSATSMGSKTPSLLTGGCPGFEPGCRAMAVTAQLGNVSDYQVTYAWIQGNHFRALLGLRRRLALAQRLFPRLTTSSTLRGVSASSPTLSTYGLQHLWIVTGHICLT
ncbi:unnamed protein product [Polarella glacialis]|uniref:Uncharacterized protein n=1 Tax=Polarella glacialis TaxID=89957 RepID=A0A813JRT9_POLGL|nr:unnamed protein product [Polarella glacialis]